MTSWKNLVVALVAAFVLAACSSSSDNGSAGTTDADPMPTQEEQQLAALQKEIADLRAQLGISDDADIGDSITALMAARDRLQKQIDDAADDKGKAEAAATGKALFAALGGAAADGTDNALANIDLSTAPDMDLSDGLAIDAVENAGALATNPGPVTLMAGDSAGSLGGWMGTNYAHMDAETKVENAAVVYNNQGSPDSMSFVEKYGDRTEYMASTRTYNVGTAADANVKAAAFPTAGAMTYTGAQDVPGTYDGAPGRYKCPTACTATYGDSGITLSEGWTFVHASGARVSKPDANYLYYGWWVSKNKDGVPTAASAFTGMKGMVAALTSGTDSPEDITGSATYNGHAAGKFALDYSQKSVLDGASDGGHFTADVTLTAKFGAIAAPNNGGISGTLDNFMANGESVNWSVALHRAPWGSNGAFATPVTNDAATMADETMGTTWSMGDTAADRSGTWSGVMYDELPGNAPGGDGSNIPTTVTGTFYSKFDSVGRMVGAFGADN